jgi:hypothetical protein
LFLSAIEMNWISQETMARQVLRGNRQEASKR